jgi:hypothetical protein
VKLCITERNKEPILAALKQQLPNEGLVLEIASGTGQHAAHFAAAVPTWQWQPTDVTDEGFDSIRAYTVQLPNVLPPLVLDASAPPQQWPSLKCAAVYVANVTHISPWCVRSWCLVVLLFLCSLGCIADHDDQRAMPHNTRMLQLAKLAGWQGMQCSHGACPLSLLVPPPCLVAHQQRTALGRRQHPACKS